MKLTSLFEMQNDLDLFIEKSRNIQEDVFDRKLLALLVELGELANETRCFKFWSDKAASDRHVILEEYVDSIHFILSLGIEKGWNQQLQVWPTGTQNIDLNEAFLQTYQNISELKVNPQLEVYIEIWKCYAEIARFLEFSTDDVIEAYHKKNEINYIRQQSGY